MGVRHGTQEAYWSNGQLNWKGDYKNNKQEGFWRSYNQNGSVDEEDTGTFKNGVKVSD